MTQKSVIISIAGLLAILTGVWVYQMIGQSFKASNCQDKGGHWNYETQKCEYGAIEERVVLNQSDSLSRYKQLADEQHRKTYTTSEYNTDLETENITRPEKTIINNLTVDTTHLFKIWTLEPNGPHADFWFKRTEFYVVDYDGNGAMPYRLDGDSLIIYYNDFVQKGRIISVSKDTLIIHWNDSETPTVYVEWKN